MAGPIRELLARQPVRNVIRRAIGLPERYGFMGDRMAAASTSDDMQGTNLMSGMRRLGGRRNQSVSQVPTTNTTARPVAPSPEAQAVNMARQQDEERRVAKRRESEGLLPPPAEPVAQAQAATPAAPASPPNGVAGLLQMAAERKNQADELFQQAQESIGSSPTPVTIARASPLFERAGRVAGEATYLQGLALATGAEERKQQSELNRALAVQEAQNAGAREVARINAETENPYKAMPEMVRRYGLADAVEMAVTTAKTSNPQANEALVRDSAMEAGLAELLRARAATGGAFNSPEDAFVTTLAQEAARRHPSTKSSYFGFGTASDDEAPLRRQEFVKSVVRRYLEGKQLRGENVPANAYPLIFTRLTGLVEQSIRQMQGAK